jgi:hypothetical protein
MESPPAVTVVDRCSIAQVRMTIGLADCDIVNVIFVFLESGQYAFRREPVDRCHHRGPDQPREGERYEIGLVVNQVEVTGLRVFFRVPLHWIAALTISWLAAISFHLSRPNGAETVKELG